MESNKTSELESALSAGEFERADHLTRMFLGPPLTPEMVRDAPQETLTLIDDLWARHCNCRCRPAEQARIWRSLGAPVGFMEFESMSQEERKVLGCYEIQFVLQVGWASPAQRKGAWGGIEWSGPDYEARTLTPGSLPFGYLIYSYNFGLVGLTLAAVAARF